MVELLTDAEHELITKLGSLMGDFGAITGSDTTRENDQLEVLIHVHALQALVMAQAAARAYPTLYRGLGTRLCEHHEAQTCDRCQPLPGRGLGGAAGIDWSLICTQCGQPFTDRACGPTHALLRAERAERGESADGSTR
jgi:hypothetical protein